MKTKLALFTSLHLSITCYTKYTFLLSTLNYYSENLKPLCMSINRPFLWHFWGKLSILVEKEHFSGEIKAWCAKAYRVGLSTPIYTNHRYNYKTSDLFWWVFSLSRIFTDFIMHNYRSNQSALMTRCETDFRHQYGIFGGELQTSFTRIATRAGSEEERLFLQASVYDNYQWSVEVRNNNLFTVLCATVFISIETDIFK